MAKSKFRINIFDAVAIVAIALVVFIVALSYGNRPYLGSRTVSVEVKISNADTIKNVLPKLKPTETVYFSGTKYPVTQTSYRTEKGPSGKVENLFITIQGPGDIVSGRSIFNGQRIFINQKVEIRDDYQVQGYVTDYRYDD